MKKNDTYKNVNNIDIEPSQIEDKEPNPNYIFRPSKSSKPKWVSERIGNNFKRGDFLGNGHSSKVYKLQNTNTGVFYAEKVRMSSGLARSVYSISFQAPTPDRNEDAVKVAVLTRNLLTILVRKWRERDVRIPSVADAIGYRWDDEEKTYSIITEFVEGRGPKPLTDEIFDLTDRMDLLQPYLLKAGLFGPAWQIDKSNMTSTANFKFNEKEGIWYWIDSEPGMVALKLGPKKKYISEAKKAGFTPLFADIDFLRLREYVKNEGITGVDNIIDLMEQSMKEWKESEIAIFRNENIHSQKIKKWYIQNWRYERKLSKKTENMLNKSNLVFLLYLMIGKIASFGLNSVYREKRIEDFFRKLEKEDVIPRGYRKHFILNYLLKKLCPRTVHHYLMNRSFRRYINGGLINRNKRTQIAKDYIYNGIREWEESRRLTKNEAEKTRKDCDDSVTMDVYLTGFGIHLLFKGLTIVGDLLAIINILGTSGIEFLEPITLEFLLINGLPWPFNAVGPLFLGPILRLSYVIYSKVRCILEGRKVPHSIAAIFSFGKFGIGTMAFPAQMMFSENKFTMGYLLSKMGKKIPIFGGSDSRIEHWFIRRANMKNSIATFKTRIANVNKFDVFRKRPVPVREDYGILEVRT
ncbi:MAG: hypothetical protein JSV56_07025 [Methanomassiliicoccales archaeon]|nr:MAG: hypothetical protein JSV56_07025 [Methanomassiliicoccales archaeon]